MGIIPSVMVPSAIRVFTDALSRLGIKCFSLSSTPLMSVKRRRRLAFSCLATTEAATSAFTCPPEVGYIALSKVKKFSCPYIVSVGVRSVHADANRCNDGNEVLIKQIFDHVDVHLNKSAGKERF